MPKEKAIVALDLDALEREGDPGPYPIKVGGKVYELVDPENLDYRELLDFMKKFNEGNAIEALRLMIPGNNREEFFDNELPPWKLTLLCEGYVEHFGLKMGEADASPPS